MEVRSENSSQLLRTAFFAGYGNDMAVIRRISTLKAIGCDLLLFGFGRKRIELASTYPCRAINLGEIKDGMYWLRGLTILRAITVILRQRSILKECAVFYARNLDMAILAVVVRALLFIRPLIVYEVLDIPKVMTRKGSAVSSVARFLERMVLSKTECLVVSSPEYIENFFSSVQNYKGTWKLVENKVPGNECGALMGSFLNERLANTRKGVWVVGWFGTLRRRRSLLCLRETVRVMNGKVRVEMRGFSAALTQSSIEQVVEESDGQIMYGGPYDATIDLPEMYRRIHFVWCADIGTELWNDRFLLPNRLYEGGYFGVPILALKGTTTGRYVEQRGLGWCLENDEPETVIRFFSEMTVDKYSQVVRRIYSLGPACFSGDAQIQEMLSYLRETLANKRTKGISN